MMGQTIDKVINKGGTMSVLLLVTLIGQMCGQIGISADGVMDEMLVTAPRLHQETAVQGLLPEVVITAPRYEGEDTSLSGMLPEIVVTASRYDTESSDYPVSVFGNKVPINTLGIILY
jgi:hypothetical protein